jgi:hypothetical protein
VATVIKSVSPLIEYCAAAVSALTSQYEMTNVLGHAATAGAARESLIQNFFVDHLPEMTSVVSGVIVDATGNRSKQQDIVLMLKSMPRLRFASGHDLIFQEGAVGTFEIKTTITQRSILTEIGENIQSVRALIPTSKGGARVGNLSWPHARIFTAILTYGGAALPTISAWLEELPDDSKPDLYIDLSKGGLLKNEGIFEPKNEESTEYIEISGPALGLARLLTILADLTAMIEFREVKWNEYIDGVNHADLVNKNSA